MHLALRAFFLLIWIKLALTDFLGPTYPAPLDLSSASSLVFTSWSNLTSIFDAYLRQNRTETENPLAGTENVTFSLGLFSTHDSGAAELQYHYTSPEIANSANGTKKVDGNSIYHLASISKLITVFAGLLGLKNEDWNRPLTEILPGLENLRNKSDGNTDLTRTFQWNKITPWALAAQLAGVPQEGLGYNDLLFKYEISAAAGLPVTDPVTYGFPPTNISVLGPCATSDPSLCSADDFIKALRSQAPSFQPWNSPGYSDDAFMFLGLVISKLTGKSRDAVYNEYVFEPLNMTSSNASVPTGREELERSVIPGEFAVDFGIEGGITIPSGGLFSTINDLAKLGVGILNSTLLKPEDTRKWMKPITHTASLSYSVGAPWEIIRYVHPSTKKVTDLYTKLGDAGYRGGCIILIPDYNAGFNILAASTNETLRSSATLAILDKVAAAIIPAFEAQAAAEAARKIVGTYFSTDPSLNSSVTISLNESTVEGTSSGLSVSSWISNSTDVLATDLFDGIKPRLLPTIPKEGNGPGKAAFQVSKNTQSKIYEEAIDKEAGPFTGFYYSNFDWLTVDFQHYAGKGVRLFVFDLDEKGCATAVIPAVTGVKLEKRK